MAEVTDPVRPAVPVNIDLDVTVDSERLVKVRHVVAIVRDVLIIGFMVATLVFAGRLVSAISSADVGGTGAGSGWSVPETIPNPPTCVGEEPCS